MSKRPTLSLKREPTTSIEPELTSFKLEEEKSQFDQVAFEKKARKERMKRYHTALDVVKSLNLPMPLAKGIGGAIVIQLKGQGISSKAARWALQRWTHSDVYLAALINGKCRFNLDGTEAELITDAEREYSRSILEARN
ncbi:ProQ/FINO family protein [Vibrio sp. 10N.222.55.E8]|uniref:ProQ/FINO family protein n=1 Tax=Vibrio artabrorum TaxID=446374 RepID=UPI0035533BD9